MVTHSDLRWIVRDVSRSPTFEQALETLVRRVRTELGVTLCSIYLLDDKGENCILRASSDRELKENASHTSLKISEGLVGRVVRRGEPVNLEYAPGHAEFVHLPGISRENLNSFLAVPVAHRGRMVGVIVVQRVERERFSADAEAFLQTLSAQLAMLIAEARTEALFSEEGAELPPGAVFQGVSGVAGVGIGAAVVIAPQQDLYKIPWRRSEDPGSEKVRFQQCLRRVRQDIKQIGEQLGEKLPAAELGLFDVYLRILDNDGLAREIIERIDRGEWAEGAVSHVSVEHAEQFARMDDEYLSERASDILDLGRRLLHALEQSEPEKREYPEEFILVGEELSVSELGAAPAESLRGLVSMRGSRNSHVAILARSLGIPSVMGVQALPLMRIDNCLLVVDGTRAQVQVAPREEQLRHYREILERQRSESEDLAALRDLPCETKDGHRVSLLVNTGLSTDISRSLESRAEGVGLYRTEILFTLRNQFPAEEEQLHLYRKHLEAFAPLPVTMRTLDIGGDKALPYFPIREENPFLGWRGIRVTLDHPELFILQVRAMLRASEGLNNLRIMLPMLSNLEQLAQALQLIQRAHTELLEEEMQLQLPPIGVMIEVPAAVYQAREYARRVDFLSVGSNDLTQYLLAVDRNNSQVADLYQSLHPAVLRALNEVVQGARAEGKPAAVCGELAGEPLGAVLLVAMGYDALSMGAANLLRVKSALRKLDLGLAGEVLSQAMQQENAEQVRTGALQKLEQEGLSLPTGAFA